MRKIWFALLFFAGGITHEIRNPTHCLCIASRQPAKPGTSRRT